MRRKPGHALTVSRQYGIQSVCNAAWCADKVGLLLENNDSETPAGNILPRNNEELSICGSSSVIMGEKN